MRRLLVPVLCLMAILVQPAAAIDESTARVVVRAYIFNNPLYLQEMDELLNQNRSLFLPDGAAIRCMRNLGIRLSQAGFNAYNPHALENAYRVGGPPEMAQDVARGLDSLAGGLSLMGGEFTWLSQVLPAAVQGNVVPYLTTKPFGRPLTIKQGYDLLVQMSNIGIAGQLFQLTKEIMNQQMPFREDQMVLMVIMYGD